jgi:hypothetical protein
MREILPSRATVIRADEIMREGASFLVREGVLKHGVHSMTVLYLHIIGDYANFS